MNTLDKFAFPPRVTVPENAYGVLTIPDLKITLPLYQDHGKGQVNIDRENAGNLNTYGRNWLIEDHAGSKDGAGVWEMGDVKIDMIAWLQTRTRVYKYTAYQITKVDNRKWYFSHAGKMVQALSSKDILTTSCTEQENVQILVAWQYVYDMPV